MKVKVAINGYGTIGKRVADAVSLQPDMEIVGVAKRSPNFEARMASRFGFPLYVSDSDTVSQFDDAGIKVEGGIGDLVDLADVVIDCTPGNVGAQNKESLYAPKETKAIFQGGEKPHVGQASFNALCNYKDAIGKDYVRVVSCNTTGSSRLLGTLNDAYGIEKVFGVYIRRGADPAQIKKGPINAIVPNPPTVPSHHGPDVKTVLPIDIDTIAVLVPTTIMHLHEFIVNLKKKPGAPEVLDLLNETPRIVTVSAAEGIHSTANIVEYARDLKRSRNDIYENCVWRESVSLNGHWLFVTQAIGQESIVVPENIDCIRAMCGLENDPMKSIEMTDKRLGVKKGW